MGYTTWEEWVGHGGFFVDVRVELISGLLGEVQDLLQADVAQFRGELITNAQGIQRLAEWVFALALVDLLTSDGVSLGTLVPNAGDGGEHIGRALHSAALHVVLDSAHTTELFATPCTARTTVDQVWHGRAVAG